MIRISINLYYTGDCGIVLPLNYIICAKCAGSKKCKGACHRRLRDCQFENDSGICRSCTRSAARRLHHPNQTGAGPTTLSNSTQSAPSTSGYLAPPAPSNLRVIQKFVGIVQETLLLVRLSLIKAELDHRLFPILLNRLLPLRDT